MFELCSLPLNVFCDMVGYWVDLKSIVVLDAAVCNHSMRGHFNHLLGTKALIHYNLVALDGSRMVQWLHEKSFRIANIQFGVKTSQSLQLARYFKLFGDSVRSVHFHGECNEVEMMYLVASHCRNVAILRCSRVLLSYAFHAILLNNPNIEEIWVMSATCLLDDLMTDLSFNKLRIFSVFNTLCAIGFAWSESTSSCSLQRAECAFIQNYFAPDLMSLARNCSHLRSFSCAGINIEDASLKIIIQHRPEIINFDISGNSEITDDAIQYLAQNLPYLRTLNIHSCRRLTVWSLAIIAAHCQQLRMLYFSIVDPNYATERAVKVFSQKCTSLTYLNIHSSFVLCSTTCTSSLLKGCPALRVLVVNSFKNVSPTTRELCAIIKPQLKIRLHEPGTEYNVLTLPI